jgi:hypothetical protein
MWIRADDGSVIDANGRVIFFSIERFVSDICLGECCFICGVHPGTAEFNNEHILPERVLRRYNLFASTITLPNEKTVRYDRYTIPCCAKCNSLMGEVVERPISEVAQSGADSINRFLTGGELLKMFVWMGLIFLKTHLKDRAVRYHLDARKGDNKIADEYDSELLHHIHTVVRCFYTGCIIQKEVIGTFLAIPVRQGASEERFDFGDLYLAQTMMLRLDDAAILAVFNGSGGAMNYFYQKLDRITGPVSELQLREVLLELALLNLHLKDRPEFQSEFDRENEIHRIVAMRPTSALEKVEAETRGKMLYHALRHAIPNIKSPGALMKNLLRQ